MPPILRSRASALASLIAIAKNNNQAADRPLVTLRGYGGLLDAVVGGDFTEPRATVAGGRQRRADIFDRLEL